MVVNVHQPGYHVQMYSCTYLVHAPRGPSPRALAFAVSLSRLGGTRHASGTSATSSVCRRAAARLALPMTAAPASGMSPPHRRLTTADALAKGYCTGAHCRIVETTGAVDSCLDAALLHQARLATAP